MLPQTDIPERGAFMLIGEGQGQLPPGTEVQLTLRWLQHNHLKADLNEDLGLFTLRHAHQFVWILPRALQEAKALLRTKSAAR